MFSWFGKKEGNKVLDGAIDAVKGVGTWIDERNLTDEEKVKYKLANSKHLLDLLKELSHFKIVQRIIVSIVFGFWAFASLNLVVACYIEWVFQDGSLLESLISVITEQFIWVPVAGASGLYLGGGLVDSVKRKS